MKCKYYKIGTTYISVNSKNGFVAFEDEPNSGEILYGIDKQICDDAQANGEEIKKETFLVLIERPLFMINHALKFLKQH